MIGCWSVAGHRAGQDSSVAARAHTAMPDDHCPKRTVGSQCSPPRAAGWTEAARQEKREELRALILAVLRRNPGTWYYQGLHDVASVFLFTVGPSMAERLLGHLLCCHLRDATRPDLGAITQILCIVYPLLEVVRQRWGGIGWVGTCWD